MRWVCKPIVAIVLCIAVTGCGDTASRSTDDGARNVRERLSEIEQKARDRLADTPADKAGSYLALLFPEVLSYEIDGDTVTWHL